MILVQTEHARKLEIPIVGCQRRSTAWGIIIIECAPISRAASGTRRKPLAVGLHVVRGAVAEAEDGDLEKKLRDDSEHAVGERNLPVHFGGTRKLERCEA